uniref:RRM domain-containing protein n=2 Tax=Caenorhabditis tropicalis TaxID=1561998 RepID=A0A1I7UN16_9PELO
MSTTSRSEEERGLLSKRDGVRRKGLFEVGKKPKHSLTSSRTMPPKNKKQKQQKKNQPDAIMVESLESVSVERELELSVAANKDLQEENKNLKAEVKRLNNILRQKEAVCERRFTNKKTENDLRKDVELQRTKIAELGRQKEFEAARNTANIQRIDKLTNECSEKYSNKSKSDLDSILAKYPVEVNVEKAKSSSLSTFIISNLAGTVTQKDLEELFEQWQPEVVQLHFDLYGNSLRSAVLIVEQSQVEVIKSELKNMLLDGKRIEIWMNDERTEKTCVERVSVFHRLRKIGDEKIVGERDSTKDDCASESTKKEEKLPQVEESDMNETENKKDTGDKSVSIGKETDVGKSSDGESNSKGQKVTDIGNEQAKEKVEENSECEMGEAEHGESSYKNSMDAAGSSTTGALKTVAGNDDFSGN